MALVEKDQAVSSIPFLTEDNLISFLSTYFNMNITKNDLCNPKPETVIAIYESLMKDFGYNVDVLSQPHWQATQMLDGNLEYYEETFSLMNLLMIMKLLTRNTGLDNFTVKDILEPKRKRLRRILSHMINLWHFWGLMMQDWCEIENEYKEKEIFNRKKELEDEINELKRELNQKKAYLNQLQSTHNQREEEFRNCVQAFEGKELIKGQVSEKYQVLKQKEVDCKSRTSNVNVDISSLRERKRELESKIVSKQQKEELEKMASKAQLYSNIKEEVVCKINLYEERQELHSKVDEELSNAMELINNIEDKQSSDQLVLSEIEEIYTESKTEKQKLKNRIRLLEEKNSIFDSVKEREQKEEMKHKKQVEEFQELIAEQLKYIENLQTFKATTDLEAMKVSNRIAIEEENIRRKEFDKHLTEFLKTMYQDITRFAAETKQEFKDLKADLDIIEMTKIDFDED